MPGWICRTMKKALLIIQTRFVCFFLFLMGASSFFAQQSAYSWPIDSPLVITGTYGELRPNHFHAGIDFSTSGKVNLPVYAVADGYVSRVRISPVGYGKSLYVTHGDGRVTVYAHLNSFFNLLDSMLRAEIYRQRVYEIDFLPDSGSVKVKKGQIIALSGNSGGSTGPHLHFEIRDEITEVPLNPLHHYKIKDKVPPDLSHVAFYDLADTCWPKLASLSRIRMLRPDSAVFERDHITLPHAIIGLGFSGLDRMAQNGNRGNIHAVQVLLDGRQIYSHHLSAISFDESRYVNEYSETFAKVKIQRCFQSTIYPASMYNRVFNKGRILLADTAYHLLKLVLFDEVGNRTSAQVWVRASKFNFFKPTNIEGSFVNCANGAQVTQNGASLYIPPAGLFYSAHISIENKQTPGSGIRIISTAPNLALPAQLVLPLPEKFRWHAQKMVLRGSAAILPILRNDSLVYSIKNFEKYMLVADTVAPLIKMLAPSRRTPGAVSLSFYLRDNLSGVGKYELYLNDNWIWADYDGKSNLLTYTFDKDDPKGLLKFRLVLWDRAGNSTTAYFLFRR